MGRLKRRLAEPALKCHSEQVFCEVMRQQRSAQTRQHERSRRSTDEQDQRDLRLLRRDSSDRRSEHMPAGAAFIPSQTVTIAIERAGLERPSIEQSGLHERPRLGGENRRQAFFAAN